MTIAFLVIAWLLFAVLMWQALKHFRFSKGFAAYFAFPIAIFGIAMTPFYAMAQGITSTAPTVFGMPLESLILIWLALVDLAKRVAEAVPGTKEDRIIGIVDAIGRKLIDFLAGRYGLPNDPSMVQRTPPPAPSSN
jgi:hypothetical protein